MKKSVFSVDVSDARTKKAAFQVVSDFRGVESLSIDTEKKKLTVVGEVDPVKVAVKLRKLKSVHADIETVEEKGDNKKKEETDDKGKQQQEMEQIIRAHYNAYYPNYWPPYYYYPCYISVEEDPSACVIC